MDFVVAICLICMLVIIFSTIIKLCVLGRAEKLSYIKNFKKGKFALIYIAAIPLYLIGIMYKGVPFGGALLLSIKACVDLVVLKFDYNAISLFMNDNLFYCVTMYICFTLVVLNAAFFTLTLFFQHINNWLFKMKAIMFSKRINIIVGFNEQNKSIIKSIDKKAEKVILLSKYDKEVVDFSFVEKCGYIKIASSDSVGALISKLFKKFDNKTANVIINTGNDSTNLIYVEQISNVILKMNLSDYSCDDTRGINVRVFGEPENASAFLHFVEKTNGCVQYVNKYKMIAMDFVDKYPITEFMSSKQIDYTSATIKNDTSINIVMVGFGKTNQQIFLTSVANNQLLTKVNETLAEKPINYWIYDKKDSKKNKNLNHTYYRYSNEMSEVSSNYLPLPPKPANEGFFELDINDTTFYESVKEHLSVDKGLEPYNYIVIAFGSDMENLDFAEKICAKLKEWNLFSQTKVFVKIRDCKLDIEVINKEYAPESGFVTFGNENKVVYNFSKIIAEKKEIMARDKHLCYSIKGGLLQEVEEEVKAKALKKWYSQAQVQRESNIYACLSVRMKLQLLGFDYCDKDETAQNANDAYQVAYETNDPIIYDDSKNTVKGKRTIVYTNNYVVGSVRNTFAIQEHQRWNAYMISCGIIPSTIKQIEAGDSKNLALRRHGNITTFEGLIEFRKIIAKLENCSEEDADVIKYDYQIMDDLVWLLTKNGYKIIKKQPTEK
ncbi:MAG: hypothetical protein RSB59_00140 [Clostridia bacterium]